MSKCKDNPVTRNIQQLKGEERKVNRQTITTVITIKLAATAMDSLTPTKC